MAVGLAMMPVGAVATETADGPVDASEYVTLGVISYVDPGTGQTVTVDRDYILQHGLTLEDGTELKLQLQYVLPKNTFDNDGPYRIQYQLLSQFSIRDKESGHVTNGNGVVGDYIIDQSGLITITFDPEKINTDTEIEGSLSFNASAHYTGDGDDQGFQIPIPGGGEVTVTIKKRYDLTVGKKAEVTSTEDGTVKYTITVKSQYGTPDVVTLTDTMTDIAFDGSGEWSVIDKNGDPVSVDKPADGSANFNLTLPQMNAGDEYTITYTGKVGDGGGVTAGTTAKNSVSVESEDEDGNKVDDDHDVETPFDPGISKTGDLSADGTSVTWIITVNKDKLDIGGWKLTDIPGKGIETATSVTMREQGASGAGQTITLPYTFPEGSAATYEILVTTPVTGMATPSNSATLTPPEGGPGEEEGSGSTTVPVENPLTKEAGDSADDSNVDADGNTNVVMEWTATIKPTVDVQCTTDSPCVYTDTLQTGWNGAIGSNTVHQFTEAQQDEIRANVVEAFRKAGLNVNAVTVEFTDNDQWIHSAGGNVNVTSQFTVTYTGGTIPADTPIEFTYHSTGVVPGAASGSVTYTNNATWGDFSGKDEFTYLIPEDDTGTSIEKVGQDGGAENSTVDWNDVYTSSEGSRYLLWTLNLNIGSDAQLTEGGLNDTALTITETLPEGMRLFDTATDGSKDSADGNGGNNGLHFSVPWGSEDFIRFTGNDGTAVLWLNDQKVEIKAQVDPDNSRNITITIPKAVVDFVLDKKANNASYPDVMPIAVRAVIGDDALADLEDKSNLVYQTNFNNEVRVSDADGGELDSDSHQQTVSKDVYESIVAKKNASTETDKESNLLRYQVKVNPDGLCLDSTVGGAPETRPDPQQCAIDQVTLHDAFTAKGGDVSFTLSQGNIAVYRMNGDGSKGDPLDSSLWSYVYEQAHGSGSSQTHSLTFTLPNQTPLIVEYVYSYSGDENSKATVSNSATLSGKAASVGDLVVNVQESAATAANNGLTLYKVDADNNNATLAGAEFELYKYKDDIGTPTPSDWEKVKLDSPLVTDEEGKLFLRDAESGEGLETIVTFNTAYALLEVKAPEGYSLPDDPQERVFLFVINHDDLETYPRHVPNPYTGVHFQKSATFYFTNSKAPETYTLSVNKTIADDNGKPSSEDLWNDDWAFTFRMTPTSVQLDAGGTMAEMPQPDPQPDDPDTSCENPDVPDGQEGLVPWHCDVTVRAPTAGGGDGSGGSAGDVADPNTNANAFGTMTFTEPGTYVYTIAELPDEGNGSVEYSKAEWELTVVVKEGTAADGTDNQLQVNASVKQTKDFDGNTIENPATSASPSVSFTNRRSSSPSLPSAGGGGSSIFVMGGVLAVLTALCGLSIMITKKEG